MEMSEGRFKPTISFKLHYKCQYGRAVYLAFNSANENRWDICSAIRLNWTKDNYWIGTPDLSFDDPVIWFNYKYFIADWDRPEHGSILWEKGLNRCFRFDKIDEKIYIEDKWEHQKFEVIFDNFLGPDADSKKALAVAGSLVERAFGTKVVKMNCVTSKRQKQAGSPIVNWKSPYLWLPLYVEEIAVSIYILDLVNKVVLKNRRYELFHLLNPEKAVRNQQKGVRVKGNCIYVTQEELSIKNFVYNVINERIIVGAAIYDQKELELLISEGVGAILDLQTTEDTDYMVDDFQVDEKLPLSKFPIQDYSEDVIDKAVRAANLLNSLIENHKRVYVHCTYGVARSIYVVIAYLCIYEGLDIAKAIRKVTLRRFQADPKEDICQRMLADHVTPTQRPRIDSMQKYILKKQQSGD